MAAAKWFHLGLRHVDCECLDCYSEGGLLRSDDAEVAVTADETRGVLDLPEAEPAEQSAAHVAFVTGEVRWQDEQVCVVDGVALIAAAFSEGMAR